MHAITGAGLFTYSSDPDEVVLSVADSSDGAGGCAPGIVPGSAAPSSNTIRVNYFSWSGGAATAKACGKNGSVRLRRNYLSSTGGYTNVTATFNVGFTDGSVWQDKIYILPYR